MDLPLVRELLGLYATGRMHPDRVPGMGLMPLRATQAMRAIAADLELRLGLLLAEGVTRALPYARSEAVRAGHVRTLQGASYVLHRLQDEGVIRCVGEMPPRGKGNGTRLFVPPGWRPLESPAVVVERAGAQGLADLIWIPDEPSLHAGAVKPGVERRDELFVGDGAHDGDGRRDRGGRGPA